ncbi:MAG: hypothetical protein JOZ87_18135 [Chloroflexi bacterium]|nr:hypothetical protein [Chloroflexota bacterium]
MLVEAFADVLGVLDGDLPNAEAGRLIKRVVARHGDVRELLASCEAIAAYTGDNYLPLMWRFYRSHRSTLFRLARTLRLTARPRTPRSSTRSISCLQVRIEPAISFRSTST